MKIYNTFDFIMEAKKQHGYCEAVIFPDGRLTFAVPSHNEFIMLYTGLPRETIWQLMPITASPQHWLVDATGLVCVWQSQMIAPKGAAKNQLKTMKDLIENKVVLPLINVAETAYSNDGERLTGQFALSECDGRDMLY